MVPRTDQVLMPNQGTPGHSRNGFWNDFGCTFFYSNSHSIILWFYECISFVRILNLEWTKFFYWMIHGPTWPDCSNSWSTQPTWLMAHPVMLGKHSSVSYTTIILILVILDLRQTRSLEIRFLKYLAKLDFIFLCRTFCDKSFVCHAKKEADMYSIQMTF